MFILFPFLKKRLFCDSQIGLISRLLSELPFDDFGKKSIDKNSKIKIFNTIYVYFEW